VSRRWSNTPLWLRTVRVFEEIASRSWRATAAKRGGVERHELRACIDRELTVDEAEQIDKFLLESLVQHFQDLDRRRARATSLIAEIQHASYERVTGEIETGTVDDAHMPSMLDARPMIEWWWRQFAEELAEQPDREMIAA
jgi:hypothetical protein